MADNPQEQTEAKLLAYIEGELDDLGRAEIERHIESNPKHRKLLDELSTGRRLVRMLPREAAPAELFENVQSQLERQELLSSAADVNPDNGNIRLSRWGQARAAAAVVLLATGLGVIVYNMLPKHGSGNLAVGPAETKPAATARNETDAADPARGLPGTAALSLASPFADGSFPGAATDPAGLHTLRLSRMASAADAARNLPAVLEALNAPGVLEDASADRGAAPGALPADGAASRGAIAENSPAASADRTRRGAMFDRGADRLAKGGRNVAGDEDAMYLVVASSDLPAAQRDVLTLLAETGLPYRQVSQQPRGSLAPAGGQGVPSGLAMDAAAGPSDPETAPNAQQQQGFGGGGQQRQQPARSAGEAETLGQRSLELADTALAQQSVLVVRRVPRRQATELVRSLHRPAADRYAIAYPQSVLEAGNGGLVAMKGDADQASLKEATESSRHADRKMDGIAAGGSAGVSEMKQAAQVPAESGADTRRAQASDARQTASSGTAIAATPSASTQPASRHRLIPPPVAANADKAKDVAPAMKAGRTAELSDQTRPFVANEAIELVYQDMRRNNQPLAQPMRVSPRGTIYVAGYGEFSLVGLSPTDATAKLTAAVQAKSPASKGVEVRRSAVLAEPLAAAAEPAAAPQQRAPTTHAAAGPVADEARRDAIAAPTRPAPAGNLRTESAAAAPTPRQPTPATPSPATPPSAAQALSPTPKPQSAPTPMAQSAVAADQEDLVDLVIVLQQDLAETEGR